MRSASERMLRLDITVKKKYRPNMPRMIPATTRMPCTDLSAKKSNSGSGLEIDSLVPHNRDAASRWVSSYLTGSPG